MNKREFLQLLAVAAAGGLPLARARAHDAFSRARFYDLPRFGNAHFMHFTDSHAQLLPVHFREPNVNLGIAHMAGQPPHLVGEALLKAFGMRR